MTYTLNRLLPPLLCLLLCLLAPALLAASPSAVVVMGRAPANPPGAFAKLTDEALNDEIAKLEASMAQQPVDTEMLMLGELLHERAGRRYLADVEAFEEALVAYESGATTVEPKVPERDMKPLIALYEAMQTRFGPRAASAAQSLYQLAWARYESADERGAAADWRAFAARYPKHRLHTEVLFRLGEHLFDFGPVQDAQKVYEQALAKRSMGPLRDKLMYKLAWCHFRLDALDASLKAFLRLLAHYDTTGEAGVLRDEAVKYAAQIMAMDDRDGDGKPDQRRAPKALVKRHLSTGAAHEVAVLLAFAESLKEREAHADAAVAYRLLLERAPLDRVALDANQGLIAALDKLRDLDGAAAARLKLSERFGPGSAWRQSHGGEPKLAGRADGAAEEALRMRAMRYHQSAQRLHKGKLDAQAAKRFRDAVAAYDDYLKRYPAHGTQSYEARFSRADALFESGLYPAAVAGYQATFDADDGAVHREHSAFGIIKASAELIRAAVAARRLPARADPDRPAAPSTAASPEPLPSEVKAWLAACVQYISAGPAVVNRRRVGAIALRRADMLARFAHHAQARTELELIRARFADQTVAADALLGKLPAK